MGCIALVRCVCWYYVVVWLGRSLHPDTTPPQPNHNVTPTYIDQNNTTHEITQQISRKLLRMDVLTSETCWALNNEIIKQVTSSWSSFIQFFFPSYRIRVCSLFFLLLLEPLTTCHLRQEKFWRVLQGTSGWKSVKPTLSATYGAGFLQGMPKGKWRKKFRMDINEIKINEIGQADWQWRKYCCYSFRN